MQTQIDIQLAYELIKKAVEEVFDQKISDLRLNNLPIASEDDILEIDELFNDPEKYKNQEFIKMEL